MSGVWSSMRAGPPAGAASVTALLRQLRAHPTAAGLTEEAKQLALDMANRPQDYELPSWAVAVGKGLEYLRTPEGRAARQKVVLGLVAASAASWIYTRVQTNRHREAKRKEQAAQAAAAAAAHQPIPVPSPSPDEKEKESIGDKLMHPPSEDTSLVPTQEKGAKEKIAAPGKHRVAVDAVFFARLWKILKICIPSIYTREMAYLVILTILLFARTFFSIYIAELIGMNAQSLVSRRWGRMWQGVKLFAMVTIPASAVNSGLKYFTEMTALRFRKKLSEYVHDQYLEGVNFCQSTS
jgi:hypothetical protein